MEMKENFAIQLANSLYTNFFIRDFFAKFIPGAILLFTITLSFNDYNLIKVISELSLLKWWLAVFLYGLCIITGFLIQAFGEYLKLIRANPKTEKIEVFQKRLAEFKHADLSVDTRLQRERFVIIKEMSGNVCLSLLISGIYLLIYGFQTFSFRQSIIIFFIVAFSFSIFHWYHKKHQERQRDFEIKAIDEAKKVQSGRE